MVVLMNKQVSLKEGIMLAAWIGIGALLSKILDILWGGIQDKMVVIAIYVFGIIILGVLISILGVKPVEA